ncbi:EAL domain-containing protein [Candidatus Nitrotoga arctica]|uniref:EAL domain-containing protein n=1 Tax=Candidatus Nitrotoga arctica TaxID=453162 RepID=UPI001EFC17AC|nr:EAL domain-containing protein [Candidatus Nitrotoga arctica]
MRHSLILERTVHELREAESGLRVIVEGIETREQYEFLLAQHCDEGQGYYFGRPVAVKELTILL